MIARLWHGTTLAQRAEEYYKYLKRTGLKDYRSTRGNLGVYVLRRLEGGRAHFVLVSLWRSVKDIEAFSGPDVERAVYYPEDREFLLGQEARVTQYEILEGP